MPEPSKLDAFLRGMGQGASFGWADELAPYLTPNATDKTGIPRTYAAGSPVADMRASMRADDASAERAHPAMFNAGGFAGQLPATIAMGGKKQNAQPDAARSFEQMRAPAPNGPPGSTMLPPPNPNAVLRSSPRLAPQKTPAPISEAEMQQIETALRQAEARDAVRLANYGKRMEVKATKTVRPPKRGDAARAYRETRANQEN